MMQAVNATYDGEKIIFDEDVNLSAGQKVIVTILDEDFEPEDLSDKEIDALIKKFSGSGGRMFNSAEEVDEYIRQSREDRVF
ncbi:MAG: hypothetical protein IJS81_04480 [Selenomonadaceae bacterium]|nr:hypothetical protein [Selenomonadaceae bacterium]MBQ7629452.1 hypothetical protein [Selenomonadaceae bacterium]